MRPSQYGGGGLLLRGVRRRPCEASAPRSTLPLAARAEERVAAAGFPRLCLLAAGLLRPRSGVACAAVSTAAAGRSRSRCAPAVSSVRSVCSLAAGATPSAALRRRVRGRVGPDRAAAALPVRRASWATAAKTTAHAVKTAPAVQQGWSRAGSETSSLTRRVRP